jgi:hypothetical protein
VVRFTAVLLVLVFGAVSARMILCELSCASETTASSREACHDQSDGEAPLAQLSNGHSCDHGDVVLTLTTSKVTFLERFASSIAVPSSASNTSTPRSRSSGHSAHSPPGFTRDSRPRVITHLRI